MEFKVIDLEDKPLIDSYVAIASKDISDINFTNLYMWAQARSISYATARLSGGRQALFIRQIDADGAPYYMYPMIDEGSNALEASIEALALLEEAESPLTLASLTLAEADLLATRGYEIQRSRDDDDYVYKVSDLLELRGRRFHKKKNHLNKFYQEYPDFTVETMDAKSALAMLDIHRGWGGLDTQGLKNEFAGIARVLENYDALDIDGLILSVGGERVAYSFGEVLNKEMVVIHVEKCRADILGGYQAINQQMLKAFYPAFALVNRECDLGEEGLRHAKLSYRPEFLLEKYKARN